MKSEKCIKCGNTDDELPIIDKGQLCSKCAIQLGETHSDEGED